MNFLCISFRDSYFFVKFVQLLQSWMLSPRLVLSLREIFTSCFIISEIILSQWLESTHFTPENITNISLSLIYTLLVQVFRINSNIKRRWGYHCIIQEKNSPIQYRICANKQSNDKNVKVTSLWGGITDI